MITYLIIIEIALLVLVVYESYKYFIFKYRSTFVDAIIKEIQDYEVFQRPSTKILEGQKKALKLMLEYEVQKKTYIKTERIKKNIIAAKVGEIIKLKIVNKNPEHYSLKSDSIRFRRMILAILALMAWSILTYFII